MARLNGRDPKNPRDADKRARVRALDRRRVTQHRLEALRIASPEHGHERLTSVDQGADRLLGDRLPSVSTVAGRGSGAHGQDAVEQQHALPGPSRQVAVRARLDPEVVLEFLEDVDQAAGERPDVGSDRERQADRVPGRRVGVLPGDEDADVGDRLGERSQDPVASRQVRPPCRDLLAQELAGGRDVVGHRGQRLGPVGGHQFGQVASHASTCRRAVGARRPASTQQVIGTANAVVRGTQVVSIPIEAGPASSPT